MKNKKIIDEIINSESAMLARIGQDYSLSRRQIIVRQNKSGVITNLAKIYS